MSVYPSTAWSAKGNFREGEIYPCLARNSTAHTNPALADADTTFPSFFHLILSGSYHKGGWSTLPHASDVIVV